MRALFQSITVFHKVVSLQTTPCYKALKMTKMRKKCSWDWEKYHVFKAKCQILLNCFLQCVFSAVNSGIVKQGKCLPTEYVKEYNVLLHFAMFNCVPTRM